MVSERKPVVLITGTTSGLGKELLNVFANNGYQVISVNRRDSSELKAQFSNHMFLTEDIRSLQAMEKVISYLSKQNLEPEVFILNAGINQPDNLNGLNTSQFKEVMETNLMGNLVLVEVIQKMNMKNKKLITISSTSVVVPNVGSLGYSLGKQNLEQAFDLFRKCDTENSYKWVRLGPMHSNLNRNLPPTQGLQKKIFDFLSLTPNQVAKKVFQFSQNNSKVLHPSLFVRLFYFALSLALKIAPGIYYKPYAKKGE